MTEYGWELGIDWNAIETVGVSYLRGGLVKKVNGEPDVPLPGTAPVEQNDTIIFRIFDVSSSMKVAEIGSFVILTKPAIKGQVICNSLSSLQPAITLDAPTASQSIFGNACCSWTCSPVTVTATAPARFLLTVQIQAVGPGGVVRLFSHDPEMVVGPFG
jgi:hypothetical protein